MSTFRSSEFAWAPEAILLNGFTSLDRRPNVLVTGPLPELDSVSERILPWCARPCQVLALPGALRLDAERPRTLLVRRVETLALAQQIALYDWLTASRGRVQVFSLAATPIDELVDAGVFLESLFHRLSTVRLDVVASRPCSMNVIA